MLGINCSKQIHIIYDKIKAIVTARHCAKHFIPWILSHYHYAVCMHVTSGC